MAEQHFSDEALDAGVAAWFGVTKVEAERNFIRDRMRAAVHAVLRHQPTPALVFLSNELQPLAQDDVKGEPA